MKRWSGIVTAALAVQVGTTAACGSSSDPVTPPLDADVQVLFVGNSLTGANDLPAMVQVLSEATGESFAARGVLRPDFSLEDHWNEGTALELIRRGWADVVVMQQGPSSLPESQLHLRRWVARFADEIRAAGGEPAVYMVWPSDRRSEAYDDVSASYTAAADSSGALLMPALDAWRAAWRREPGLALYGPDGFHPSTLGSFLAALTIYRVIFDRPVTELPDTLRPTTADLPPLELPAGLSDVFYPAVEEAVAASRRSSAGAPPRP